VLPGRDADPHLLVQRFKLE